MIRIGSILVAIVLAHADVASANPMWCADQSDIVGYRRCTKYGAWGLLTRLPKITASVGVSVRSAPSLLPGRHGAIERDGMPDAFRVEPAPDRAANELLLIAPMRFGMGLPYGLFVAAEAEMGGVLNRADVKTSDSSLVLHDGFAASAAGVVGIAGSVPHGRLGVELVSGARLIWYKFQPRDPASTETTRARGTAALVEARVVAELWVNPWFTAGATAGASVIDHGSWIGGLYFGASSRSFGGTR
jgi:hypothetical protein